MKEIGSEFMADSAKKGKNKYQILGCSAYRYVLSGRTGLYLIAQELKKINGYTKISIPEYSCASMIEPFLANEFEIDFYDSFNVNNNISDDSDVILIMDYFGFMSDRTIEFTKKCKDMGKVVIVDATQTAFSKSCTYDLGDYIIASYRKWADCLGAVVYSKNGFLTKNKPNEKSVYVQKWRNAANLKRKYISENQGEKQAFLNLFSEANHMIEDDYVGYTACEDEIDRIKNIDSDFMRKKRRENAQILISGIKSLAGKYKIKLLYDQIGDEDCPLFVPILVNKRDIIRKALIDESIYCPAHWPIDYRFPHVNTVYHQSEISLVCDQRYDQEDMEYTLNCIEKAFYRNE